MIITNKLTPKQLNINIKEIKILIEITNNKKYNYLNVKLKNYMKISEKNNDFSNEKSTFDTENTENNEKITEKTTEKTQKMNENSIFESKNVLINPKS